MSERAKVKAGDIVEVTLRFQVHRVEHFDTGSQGPAFTCLEYATGEPRKDGKANVFTYEVPDEFGRIVILGSVDDD